MCFSLDFYSSVIAHGMSSVHDKPQRADLSVLIVTRNGARIIERALNSIQAQTIAPAEVIVINNGSDAVQSEDCFHIHVIGGQ